MQRRSRRLGLFLYLSLFAFLRGHTQSLTHSLSLSPGDSVVFSLSFPPSAVADAGGSVLMIEPEKDSRLHSLSSVFPLLFWSFGDVILISVLVVQFSSVFALGHGNVDRLMMMMVMMVVAALLDSFLSYFFYFKHNSLPCGWAAADYFGAARSPIIHCLSLSHSGLDCLLVCVVVCECMVVHLCIYRCLELFPPSPFLFHSSMFASAKIKAFDDAKLSSVVAVVGWGEPIL